MADPPSEVGAVHVRVIVASPAIADTSVGGVDAVMAGLAVRDSLAILVPMELMAMILTVYDVPFTSVAAEEERVVIVAVVSVVPSVLYVLVAPVSVVYL